MLPKQTLFTTSPVQRNCFPFETALYTCLLKKEHIGQEHFSCWDYYGGKDIILL